MGSKILTYAGLLWGIKLVFVIAFHHACKMVGAQQRVAWHTNWGNPSKSFKTTFLIACVWDWVNANSTDLVHERPDLSIFNVCEMNQGKNIPAWIIIWDLMRVFVWFLRQPILCRHLAAQFLHSVSGMCWEMSNSHVGEGNIKMWTLLLMNR